MDFENRFTGEKSMRFQGKSCALCVLTALGLAGLVFGQSPQAKLMGGASPTEIVYKPVDMNNLAAPMPAKANRITLGGILSKFNIPGLRTSQPMPKPPQPGQAGSVGMTFTNAIQPMAPIPTTLPGRN
jgi:hypothetical protein